jgi:hypothetical protein
MKELKKLLVTGMTQRLFVCIAASFVCQHAKFPYYLLVKDAFGKLA